LLPQRRRTWPRVDGMAAHLTRDNYPGPGGETTPSSIVQRGGRLGRPATTARATPQLGRRAETIGRKDVSMPEVGQWTCHECDGKRPCDHCGGSGLLPSAPVRVRRVKAQEEALKKASWASGWSSE
jgi:hypothetical protein